MDNSTKKMIQFLDKPDEEVKGEIVDKINTLIDKVWSDSDIDLDKVMRWSSQFSLDSNAIDNKDEIQFLHLLSKFMYFGEKEMKELITSLYRDLYRYDEIKRIRKKLKNTLNFGDIETEFRKIEDSTRFLGMGKNPSESGNFLLYYFRQFNSLKKDLFINYSDVFERKEVEDLDEELSKISGTLKKNYDGVKLFSANLKQGVDRYVFLDDICASGSQALEYSEDIVTKIKTQNPKIKICYFVIFGLNTGMRKLRRLKTKDGHKLFDRVACIYELDDSFKCFSSKSRFYKGQKPPVSKEIAYKSCEKYDKLANNKKIFIRGYKDGQMLLSLHHNTPDNVPPLFWGEGNNWKPIFKRFHKIY